MLGENAVYTTIAVNDIAKGKEFYGGTLGLTQVDETPAGVLYQSGPSKVFVYESPTAGSGQATCASWKVPDVSGAVAELEEKGVMFETYDIPGATWEGSVAVMGPMKSSWFKDPDGNTLCIGSE